MLKSPEIESVQNAVNAKTGEIRRESKPDAGGYSEKEQAKDIEARSGDLSSMKRSSGVNQNTPDHAKTLDEYKSITEELNTLIEDYVSLIKKDLHQAQKMLADIEKKRELQKVLLDSLFGK